MPSGVYRLLWDAIQAQRPFAGYFRNLSADGSHYDVFATVTALPHGGYLSVRSLPMDPEREHRVFEAYGAVREKEEAARESGATARECAAVGAAELEKAIKELGYADYSEFQRLTLIDEVTRREAELSGSLGMVITNTIDLIVRAGLGIHAEVSVLAFEQGDLEELAARVEATAQRIEKDTAGTSLEMATHVATLYGQLRALGALSQQTQFHIALARLHSAMVTQYADERFHLTDPVEREESLEAIRALVDALVGGIDAMLAHISSLHSAIDALTECMATVHSELAGNGVDDSLAALRTALRRFDNRYDDAPLAAMREQLLKAAATAAS